MSKVLVAYFSASGVTAKLAERLAEAIGADLHEIQPEIPYTDADLDWMNKKSRSSVEMNNKSFRPAVANKVENMEQYSVIFTAFPIWWYVEHVSGAIRSDRKDDYSSGNFGQQWYGEHKQGTGGFLSGSRIKGRKAIPCGCKCGRTESMGRRVWNLRYIEKTDKLINIDP